MPEAPRFRPALGRLRAATSDSAAAICKATAPPEELPPCARATRLRVLRGLDEPRCLENRLRLNEVIGHRYAQPESCSFHHRETLDEGTSHSWILQHGLVVTDQKLDLARGKRGPEAHHSGGTLQPFLPLFRRGA